MSVSLTPQQDRILKRLERKYDKDAAPTRDYFTDLGEIGALLKAGVIDKDHAELLASKAKAVYKDRETKRKEANRPKRQLTPIGHVMRPNRTNIAGSVQSVSDGFTRLVSSIIMLIVVLGIASVIF